MQFFVLGPSPPFIQHQTLCKYLSILFIFSLEWTKQEATKNLQPKNLLQIS